MENEIPKIIHMSEKQLRDKLREIITIMRENQMSPSGQCSIGYEYVESHTKTYLCLKASISASGVGVSNPELCRKIATTFAEPMEVDTKVKNRI